VEQKKSCAKATNFRKKKKRELMPFCTNCGLQMQATHKFCAKCGTQTIMLQPEKILQKDSRVCTGCGGRMHSDQYYCCQDKKKIVFVERQAYDHYD